MANVEVNTDELKKFFSRLSAASNGPFKEQVAVWFDAMGMEFLDVIQDEIIRKGVVDTRLLLNSFQKSTKGNVWKISDRGLTLEVGTNVKYAQYVNDGHWTVKSSSRGAFNTKGGVARWVPGVWQGSKFVYKKGAKTGMLLKQKFVPGYHYWESAMVIFEKIFQASLDKKLQQWMDIYFGGF